MGRKTESLKWDTEDDPQVISHLLTLERKKLKHEGNDYLKDSPQLDKTNQIKAACF